MMSFFGCQSDDVLEELTWVIFFPPLFDNVRIQHCFVILNRGTRNHPVQSQPSGSDGKGPSASSQTAAMHAAVRLTILWLQQPICPLSSTACLILGNPPTLQVLLKEGLRLQPHLFLEQQRQLSSFVTSVILSRIPRVSSQSSKLLLSFCGCNDGERARTQEPREAC